MATQDEQLAIREFIGEAFADENQQMNPSLLTDFIADLIYGNNQTVKAAKDKYKAHLDSKIAKADAALLKLEQDKLDAQARLEADKAKKLTEKEKIK